MVLAEVDRIEQSFLANLDRGEQALAEAETDYERLHVRDAARAAQVITAVMGRRKLVRRFSVLVQRAERAIAQTHPPMTAVEALELGRAAKNGEYTAGDHINGSSVSGTDGLTQNLIDATRAAHNHITDDQFEAIVAAGEDTDEPMTRQELIDLGKQRRDEARRQQREQQRQDALAVQDEKGDQVPDLDLPAAAETVAVGKHSRVVFADNLDADNGLPAVEDGTVALTFTSPPYWTFAEYGGVGVGYEESYGGYVESLRRVFALVWSKTLPGGRVVVNISNMKSKLQEEGTAHVYPIVADAIKLMTGIGFTFFDEIMWVKRETTTGPMNGAPLWGSYPYPPTPKILDSTFENILVFTKPGQRSVDLGVKEQSKLTLEEWREFTKGVWRIESGNTHDHPATFPMELADRIVRMYSFVNDIVLDPFAGSGTAVVSAERNTRAGLGFEVAKQYGKVIKDKASQWLV